MKKRRRFSTFQIVLTLSTLTVLGLAVATERAGARQTMTSPEEFFGFQLGSDRKIARWDQIVEYYRLLEKQSGKIQVVDMGPSTMGNPFLLVIISSPENLDRLDHLREVNRQLSDPRGLSDDRIHGLVGEGRAVICQSMSLHATEIGGTQMAPELAYDLLTGEDEETRRILENVVFLMVPCFNPDGQIMVTDWYQKTLGTDYEGGDLPWLYHKYTGHDNNRDAFMTNMAESQYMAKIMFRDWIPQAYLDHHHMGSYGARLYVPPYTEPIRPNGDPLIWREHSWYGAHLAYKLEQAGKTGILNAGDYMGWGHLGFHWITIYHNIAGMLTESASAKLASPLYVHPDQLQADSRGPIRGFAHRDAQTNFPHPWPGGWWRLRDIVEQKKVSAWALLDMAARNKETVLSNAALKAKRQIDKGATGTPKAYVIPTVQNDPLTAIHLVNKLLVQGIEVQRATKAFTANWVTYPSGSYLVSLAQPKMGLVKNLLGRTRYPDNVWTREADGSPSPPQDTATDTLFEYMGVRVDPIDTLDGEFERLRDPVQPAGRVTGPSTHGYVFDGRLNASFRALNLLLDKSVAVRRVDESADPSLRAGDFVATGGAESALQEVARATGVDFTPLANEPRVKLHSVERLRVGMYQGYWGGNADEGWTRFVLEQFGFPYITMKDDAFKKEALGERFDVIILPDAPTTLITGIGVEEWYQKNRPDWEPPEYPGEYRSGIGEEGVEAVKRFVQGGGRLVTLGEACAFAIEKLELRVRNPLEGRNRKEFFCPGSTLRASVANDHPLGYGMPGEALVFFWDSPVFEVLPSLHNDRYEVIVKYPEKDILESGWLIGEEHLSRKAGMVAAQVGRGQSVLIGFRTQHRGQTHGTFKLLFNTLVR